MAHTRHGKLEAASAVGLFCLLLIAVHLTVGLIFRLVF